MYQRFIAGWGLVALLAVQGCGKSENVTESPSTAKKEVINDDSSTPTSKNEPTKETTTPRVPRTAKETAQVFLTSLNAGKPDLVLLGEGFKTIVAPPIFDSDKSKGYSSESLNRWFEKFHQGAWELKQESPAVGYFRGAGIVNNVPSGFLLGIKSEKVIWFHVNPGTIFEGPIPEQPVNLAAFTFAESMLAKEWNLVEAMLTDRLKAEVAPPFASDTATKYNRGMLQNKLKLWSGDAQQFELTAHSNEATIQLKGTTPKTMKVKLTQSANQWLIDECEVK